MVELVWAVYGINFCHIAKIKWNGIYINALQIFLEYSLVIEVLHTFFHFYCIILILILFYFFIVFIWSFLPTDSDAVSSLPSCGKRYIYIYTHTYTVNKSIKLEAINLSYISICLLENKQSLALTDTTMELNQLSGC